MNLNEVMRHTDDALPEVVGLALCSLIPGELPVNLVLDIGHGDEGGDDTTPAPCLDCGTRQRSASLQSIERGRRRTSRCELPVMNVSRRAEARAVVGLGEDHDELASSCVLDIALVEDEVPLACVTIKQGLVHENSVEAVEGDLKEDAVRESRSR